MSPAGVVNVQSEWMALGAFGGGVRVAAGDVVGDAAIEIVAAAGPGRRAHRAVLHLRRRQSMPAMDFYAYSPGFAGGVWVATAGAVRNPNDRLITGAGAGGTPHVRILSMAANGPTEIAGLLAYAPNFGGGVRVAGFPASSTGTTTTTSGGGSTTTGGSGGTTTTTAGGGGSTTTTAGGGGATTTTACDGTAVGTVCLPVP